MGDDIDRMQEIEERVRKANKKEVKSVPWKCNEFCPYCSAIIFEEADVVSVGDKKHRIVACIKCEEKEMKKNGK